MKVSAVADVGHELVIGRDAAFPAQHGKLMCDNPLSAGSFRPALMTLPALAIHLLPVFEINSFQLLFLGFRISQRDIHGSSECPCSAGSGILLPIMKTIL